MLGRLTNLYTRKRYLVNHSRRLTNSYAKSTNLVNRVEEHLDEELFRKMSTFGIHRLGWLMVRT
jgi:hypothetical protein